MDEHREFTRIMRRLDVDVDLGGERLAGTTRDISLNGLFAELERMPSTAQAGAQVAVTLHIDGRDGVLSATGRGSIVRRLAGGLAIRLDELVEVESYEILRNLVLYHAADPAKAESEFESHLGLRAVRP